MLTFGCPRCGTHIRLVDLRPRLSPQGRRGKRLCPGCGAWLECANGYQLSALCGAILGLAVGGFSVWAGREWTGLAIVAALAIVVGVTIAPLLVARFGRWRVLADGFTDVRKWSRVATVSALIGIAALALANLSVWLQTRRLLERVPNAQTGEALQGLAHWFIAGVILSFVAGLAIAVAALWISYRAWQRRGEARSAENPSSPA